MDITISPGQLSGTVQPGASKSLLHRYLICAALSDRPTYIHCGRSCDDVDATIDCLNAIGAHIQKTDDGYFVTPVTEIPSQVVLKCRESGTTLRLLLPIVGALGIDTIFHLSGSLTSRPITPLLTELHRMGCNIYKSEENTIRCSGRLQSGAYTIDSSISSQFVSGLLMALSLISGENSLFVVGQTESKPYIQMTRQVLTEFGVYYDGDCVNGSYPLNSPRIIYVEADWSSAAFFMAANSLNNKLNVLNVTEDSLQGDRVVTKYLQMLEKHCTIDIADTPDLLPVLSVVAAARQGAIFCGIHRLQYKESNRIESICSMLQNLGIDVSAAENSLTVKAGKFRACTIDSFGDHRIAMAAAIAATAADGPITILNAQCVSKSYPHFWAEYRNLGGSYAQHIR